MIDLADDIILNSFSLEHISAKQSVTGEILSAPREISVYVSALNLQLCLLKGGIRCIPFPLWVIESCEVNFNSAIVRGRI